MKPQKVVKDGQVAVIVSPGFGAGWSTWADSNVAEFVLFDKSLVEKVGDGDFAQFAKARVREVFGEDTYFYLGGADDCEVQWVPEGADFEVREYDGSESLDYGTRRRIA